MKKFNKTIMLHDNDPENIRLLGIGLHNAMEKIFADSQENLKSIKLLFDNPESDQDEYTWDIIIK